jgi:hypothetical protein
VNEKITAINTLTNPWIKNLLLRIKKLLYYAS